MITQIQIGKDRLVGVLHTPSRCIGSRSVLLLPGFSLPMCDMDYFMSRLARYLCGCGFCVLQMDIRGHGDSKGVLEDVTLDTVREDIAAGISFLSGRFGNGVIIVSRGLFAAVACEFMLDSSADGVAGIWPYCVPCAEAQGLLAGFSRKNSYTGIELAPGSDYRTLTDFDVRKIAFFNALGARTRNILGQRISARMLHEIVSYRTAEPFYAGNDGTCWLFGSAPEGGKPDQRKFSPESHCMSLNEYAAGTFIRNPVWQFEMCKTICMWLEGKEV